MKHSLLFFLNNPDPLRNISKLGFLGRQSQKRGKCWQQLDISIQRTIRAILTNLTTCVYGGSVAYYLRYYLRYTKKLF